MFLEHCVYNLLSNVSSLLFFLFFFFFQAEDGIRDLTVTGVQTCALPILVRPTLGTRAGTYRARAKRRFAGASPAGCDWSPSLTPSSRGTHRGASGSRLRDRKSVV